MATAAERKRKSRVAGSNRENVGSNCAACALRARHVSSRPRRAYKTALDQPWQSEAALVRSADEIVGIQRRRWRCMSLLLRNVGSNAKCPLFRARTRPTRVLEVVNVIAD
jgi:hypothetical protein